MPGVVAVFTGTDLRADGIGDFSTFAGLMNADGKPMAAPPYYPLAVDEVRFVGEAVAAVIAQTRLQAQDAAEQVTVEYEELPTVVDDRGRHGEERTAALARCAGQHRGADRVRRQEGHRRRLRQGQARDEAARSTTSGWCR